MQQEQIAEPTAENMNVGMMVMLPTEPGEKVTVFDIFFANSQGKFYALFLVIFAVLFSTVDISSGYIKNIGGQVGNRGSLIFSRSIALSVFTVLTMTGILISGSGELYCFRGIGMGKYKGDFILFCGGAGSSLCTCADLYGDCNYFEK